VTRQLTSRRGHHPGATWAFDFSLLGDGPVVDDHHLLLSQKQWEVTMTTLFANQTLTTAICAAARMAGRMNDWPNTDLEAVDADYQILARSVGALPPAILGPRFEINIREWPTLWRSGENLAARYQLVQLVRRLKTRSDGLADADDLAERDSRQKTTFAAC